MARIFGIILLSLTLIGGLMGCGPTLVVGAGTAAAVIHDRRTTGTVIEDQAIELKTYEILRANSALMEGSRVKVTSYNKVVLLSGEVTSEHLSQQIEAKVSTIPEVGQIHNELLIGPPSSLATRSNDSWLTAKSKSVLLQISAMPGFDPSRVKVVTARGNVYLMGLLTLEEADAVTATVRRVGGVQQVVKLFEYI